MKRNIVPKWILCLALGAVCSQAATVYWDNNGSAAGAGGATPNGNWNSGVSVWGNSAGTANTAPWVDGDTAAFSAGTDATGSYTVTMGNPFTVAGLIREDGTPTVAAGGANVNTFAPGNFGVGSGSGKIPPDAV